MGGRLPTSYLVFNYVTDNMIVYRQVYACLRANVNVLTGSEVLP